MAGSRLASVKEGADGRLYLTDDNQAKFVAQVDAATGDVLTRFQPPTSSSFGLTLLIELSPDRTVLYVGERTSNSTLARYALRAGESPEFLQAVPVGRSNSSVSNIAVSPDGRFVAAVTYASSMQPEAVVLRSASDLTISMGTLGTLSPSRIRAKSHSVLMASTPSRATSIRPSSMSSSLLRSGVSNRLLCPQARSLARRGRLR